MRINHIKRASGLALLVLAVFSVGRNGEAYIRAAQISGSIGNLNEPRYYHTATMLDDGRVLIAGGLASGFSAKFSVELYDPAEREWLFSGFLLSARVSHTATLLPDGKVLFVGGSSDSFGDFQLKTSELYDPATGKSTATGSLRTYRVFHTATLLNNGKVLIAGGSDGFNSSSSTELYDPSTGQWSDSGSLVNPRWGHTAILLGDGKVLFVGGVGVDTSAELYDPETERCRKTGSFVVGRYSTTATLLENGKVLMVGRTVDQSLMNTAELYDPASGTWRLTGNRSVVCGVSTMTLLPNGNVLATGLSCTGNLNLFGELYDPDSETWSTTDRLRVVREGYSATRLLDGNILVAGGGFRGTVLNTTELYDSARGTWSGPAIPIITGLSISGKKLFVVGQGFAPGAVILVNGAEQRTRNQDEQPESGLVGKSAAKRIKLGDKIDVLNPSGAISDQFTFDPEK